MTLPRQAAIAHPHPLDRWFITPSAGDGYPIGSVALRLRIFLCQRPAPTRAGRPRSGKASRFSAFRCCLVGMGSVLSMLLSYAMAGPAHAAPLYDLNPPGLADGAGVWMNIWNYPAADAVNAYCARLRVNGVRNLFVQTSRSNTDAIAHPDELSTLIDACHRYGIRVIAWSFAELINPRADAGKLVAAAQFQSASGQTVDAVAGDLEKNLLPHKVESYSLYLRQELGASYPLMAIVYSPLNRAREVSSVPWQLIGKYFDIVAPMTYWGGRQQRFDAYTYTASTIQKVRDLIGRPDVEVHVIGDGMGTSSAQLKQFLEACRASEATSASLYPNHKVTDEQLSVLGRYNEFFPANARFRLAALRELCQSGALTPQMGDPAAKISRGEFYTLFVKQLYLRAQARSWTQDRRALAKSLTATQALEILAKAGFVSESQLLEPNLMQPMEGKEAVSMIAALVQLKDRAGHATTGKDGRRWFMQPAIARSARTSEPSRTINYLDAAQMVLQARAAWR